MSICASAGKLPSSIIIRWRLRKSTNRRPVNIRLMSSSMYLKRNEINIAFSNNDTRNERSYIDRYRHNVIFTQLFFFRSSNNILTLFHFSFCTKSVFIPILNFFLIICHSIYNKLKGISRSDQCATAIRTVRTRYDACIAAREANILNNRPVLFNWTWTVHLFLSKVERKGRKMYKNCS